MLILTGTYDAFGVLRKSYRNTVEISDFANEILRHGDFAIYPVEPVLRHGTAVRKEAFDDEAALLAAGVQTIKTWQAQGYETIAVRPGEYEISIGGQQPGERSRALTGRETEILTVRKEGNEENVEY